jgi:ribose/xylose/arabinose/galactoside ABC-type transport system permease subunit
MRESHDNSEEKTKPAGVPDTSAPGSHWGWGRYLNLLGPLIGLAAVFTLFAVKVPDSFLTLTNFETIARQTAIVGIAALGMTLVIVSGGIDLSVGSIIALCSVVVATLVKAGVAPLYAALGGVAAGALCGLVNGVLITRLRVVPFIVTLGTMLIVRGAAKGIAQEQTVNPDADTWLNTLTASLGPDQKWMIVPPGVWIMILLALLVTGALRYTRLGRHTFAIGSNEQTAQLCGVRVNRVKILLYTLCAAFAGLAGVMQFSRLTLGDPTAAVGMELNVIAAVVIGGGSLSGGEGSVLGTLVGALIMTVIDAGCSHMSLANWVQEIATGVIIVLAVALDRYRQRHASGASTRVS